MHFIALNWAFLLWGAFGLTVSLNALRPTSWFLAQPVSFFAQWLVAELAPWWIAFTLTSTALLIAAGALVGWPGYLGLVLCTATIAVLGLQVSIALGTGKHVQQSLIAAGFSAPEPHPGRWMRTLLPLWFGDARLEKLTDLRYAEGAGSRHLLDIYRPKAGVSGAPVLLQIHGGAWVIGSKRDQGRPLMNRMAAAGWVCVAINYRLSPGVRFPEHLIDCKLALKWVKEHIAEYGGDPTRVVVTGGSAGGHLAALVALTQNVGEFQPGFESADTSVLACVPIYGPFDIEALFANRHKGVAGWFAKRVFGGNARNASPMTHVKPGLPPMLVVQGGADNLVPVRLAHRFVDAMRAAGNSNVVLLEVKGAAHAFEVFHSIRTEAVISGIHQFLVAVAQRAKAPS